MWHCLQVIKIYNLLTDAGSLMHCADGVKVVLHNFSRSSSAVDTLPGYAGLYLLKGQKLRWKQTINVSVLVEFL